MSEVWEFLKGKKTYIVGACAIVYGIYIGEMEPVLLGLGLLGLRDGISSEIASTLVKPKRKK